MKKSLITTTAVLAIIGGVSVLYARPVVNIDSHHHGNLAAAQNDIVEAYDSLDRAQKANEDQLGGHAQKAKELLIEADQEIRRAANVANAR
jgi:hypothetical protein